MYDELADYLMQCARNSEASYSLERSLGLGQLLINLPEHNRIAPYIRGSIAETYMRLAFLDTDVTKRAQHLENASSNLKSMIALDAAAADDQLGVARYGMLRLAELYASQGDVTSVLEEVREYSTLVESAGQSKPNHLDAAAVRGGVYLVAKNNVAEEIGSLNDEINFDGRNLFLRLLKFLVLSQEYNAEDRTKTDELAEIAKVTHGMLLYNNFYYEPGIQRLVHAMEAVSGWAKEPAALQLVFNKTGSEADVLLAVLAYDLAEGQCGSAVSHIALEYATSTLARRVSLLGKERCGG